MKPYTKVPQSNTDLAILLQNRGLVANSTKLLRILETVGYYRFTGYLHPFRMPNSDAYRPNTTLETVWDIYMFDRRLWTVAYGLEKRAEHLCPPFAPLELPRCRPVLAADWP